MSSDALCRNWSTQRNASPMEPLPKSNAQMVLPDSEVSTFIIVPRFLCKLVKHSGTKTYSQDLIFQVQSHFFQSTSTSLKSARQLPHLCKSVQICGNAKRSCGAPFSRLSLFAWFACLAVQNLIPQSEAQSDHLCKSVQICGTAKHPLWF